MSEKTIIAWTDRTWNPWRGCTKISPGCKNCYMFTAQERYGRDPSEVVRTGTWRDPVRWQKDAAAAGRSERIFTCSWSDWFHEDADRWRDEAWAIIRRCPNLIFQVLTKRADRIATHLPADWGDGYPNVWLGVSVEDRRRLPRIDLLRAVPGGDTLRFLSIEPLLEDLGHVDLHGIHWVIVGGESGPGYRNMEHAWARSLRDQCQRAHVPFFFKQSAAPRTEQGIELDGQIIREYPRISLPTIRQNDLF
ncbi:MAG TPA: phage Gp37/Gp68 family protein [Acidisoma sp.]|jgi:protein gp37|nr:phage Gp37/Gp68 family protein [Acidisoma sp.]